MKTLSSDACFEKGMMELQLIEKKRTQNDWLLYCEPCYRASRLMQVSDLQEDDFLFVPGTRVKLLLLNH